MILTIVRGDRFCEGLLLEYLDNGLTLKWMRRLEEIDNQKNWDKVSQCSSGQLNVPKVIARGGIIEKDVV